MAPKRADSSLALTPPPAQPPTGAGEAQGFMDKNHLAPLIIALNVVMPLFSILFLVMMLRSSG